MTERVSEFGTSVEALLEERDLAHKTAGQMLREARESHGLQIEVVAAALKVPAHRLAALEADDIASLPDAVFARALAGSVCRALRIDPLPVLAKLPPGARRDALAAADRTIRTSIVSGTPRWNSRSGGRPSRALLLIVLLLLVGAAALFWLPQPTLDRLSASVARLVTRGQPQAGAQQPSADEESAIAATPAAGGDAGAPPQSASASASASPAGGPATTQGVLAADSAAAATAATASADPAAAAANSVQTLVFVARDPCWITVTDTAGKQLLHRTVVAGETVGLSSTLALSVVVGRASSVDVQVRGKPFDLTTVTRNGGVARFEVKTS
jgi:cytoskeleton protein RodZ